ncbi:MAG: hypothetical protein EXR72_25475 [Myxococcales bacterium]|nr:hypothetical protein [Myxococcales bacterium]
MRIHYALLWVFGIGGCGGKGEGADMAARDLAEARDLLPEAQDLASYTTFRYVSDQVTVPIKKTDFARDLNGDEKLDNKLGEIGQTLVALNVDLQAQEQAAIAKGDGLFLFSLSSLDPLLVDDDQPSLTVYSAVKMDPPDFGPKGTFTVDKSVPKAVLKGPLTKGAYESTDPRMLTAPPTMTLNVVLAEGTSVKLPVVGARIGFTPTVTRLKPGQLNGAIKKTDIDKLLVPAMAKMFNDTAHKMCGAMDMSCMDNKARVLNYFDKGPACENPDKTMSKPGDGNVGVCEVTQNVIVQSLLAPDVQLFDKAGAWKPSPANSDPDSLSLGVAFTAVKSSFTE